MLIVTELVASDTPCSLYTSSNRNTRKSIGMFSCLVAHGVTSVVAFHFLPQNFGKVVGTYDWYFVISMNEGGVVGTLRGGGDTKTLL